MNKSLDQYITEENIFETSQERNEKTSSVKHLETIASDWIIKKANNDITFPEESLPCRILIQGSTMLGVGFKGSDLDAVLVVPNFIQTSDFFGGFFQCLSTLENVSDLVAIQDTFVPLIKMRLNDVEIDLVLSRLSANYVPKKFNFKSICSDFYLDLDPISIRGLAGVHMAKEFANLVPNKSIFNRTLRAIRAWVRARRLNDYVYGFPSSTAWAIMAAYICLQQNKLNQNPYEEADTREMLHIFFTTFSMWQWPDPVIISPITRFDSIHTLYSWDPQRNSRDSCEVMPIITPVFPHKNSAFTARLYTRNIFTDECNRGKKIMDEISAGESHWSDLFRPYNILEKYNHFIFLTLHANDKDELNRIGGMVDARLRDFAQFLEEDDNIVGARIINHEEMKLTDDNDHAPCHGKLPRSWLIGLEIEKRLNGHSNGPTPRLNIDISDKIQSFYSILKDRAIGIDFENKLIMSYRRKSDLLKQSSS